MRKICIRGSFPHIRLLIRILVLFVDVRNDGRMPHAECTGLRACFMRLCGIDVSPQLRVIERHAAAALRITDARDLAALGIDLDLAVGGGNIHAAAECADARTEIRPDEEFQTRIRHVDLARALVERTDADDLVAAAVHAHRAVAFDMHIARQRAHADAADTVDLDFQLTAGIRIDQRIALRAADAECIRRADVDIHLPGFQADLGIIRIRSAADRNAAVTVADQLRAAGRFEGDIAVARIAVTADAVAEFRIAVDLQVTVAHEVEECPLRHTDAHVIELVAPLCNEGELCIAAQADRGLVAADHIDAAHRQLTGMVVHDRNVHRHGFVRIACQRELMAVNVQLRIAPERQIHKIQLGVIVGIVDLLLAGRCFQIGVDDDVTHLLGNFLEQVRLRTGGIIALEQIDTHADERFQICLLLHAFGQDGDLVVMRIVNDARHKLLLLGILADPVDQLAVDLDIIGHIFQKRCGICIAAAVIVNGKPCTDLPASAAQRGKRFLRALGLLNDLNDDLAEQFLIHQHQLAPVGGIEDAVGDAVDKEGTVGEIALVLAQIPQRIEERCPFDIVHAVVLFRKAEDLVGREMLRAHQCFIADDDAGMGIDNGLEVIGQAVVVEDLIEELLIAVFVLLALIIPEREAGDGILCGMLRFKEGKFRIRNEPADGISLLGIGGKSGMQIKPVCLFGLDGLSEMVGDDAAGHGAAHLVKLQADILLIHIGKADVEILEALDAEDHLLPGKAAEHLGHGSHAVIGRA